MLILLTDGVNNRGEIDPLTAAQLAQTFGIRIYTIGVGTIGTDPYPVQTPFGVQYQNMPVEIDEALMQTYGFDIDGLEDAWREAIGAQPRGLHEMVARGTTAVVDNANLIKKHTFPAELLVEVPV